MFRAFEITRLTYGSSGGSHQLHVLEQVGLQASSAKGYGTQSDCTYDYSCCSGLTGELSEVVLDLLQNSWNVKNAIALLIASWRGCGSSLRHRDNGAQESSSEYLRSHDCCMRQEAESNYRSVEARTSEPRQQECKLQRKR